MSKRYRETYNDAIPTKTEMRKHVAAPGGARDPKTGKLLTPTEQAPLDRCDVNKIIARYRNTGLIDHVARLDAQYGEVTASDYKTMMDKIIDMRKKFLEFPSDIRERFANDPAKLLDFLDNPENKEEALKLGLVRSDWEYEQEKRKNDEGTAAPPTA